MAIAAIFLLVACGAGTNEAANAGSKSGTRPDTPTSASSDDLAVTCEVDGIRLQVNCVASDYAEGARLYWWTNSEQAEADGDTFEFTIANPRPDLTVSFEECNNGSCQTVTTTLDTAHLIPPKPAGSSRAEIAVAAAEKKPDAEEATEAPDAQSAEPETPETQGSEA